MHDITGGVLLLPSNAWLPIRRQQDPTCDVTATSSKHTESSWAKGAWDGSSSFYSLAVRPPRAAEWDHNSPGSQDCLQSGRPWMGLFLRLEWGLGFISCWPRLEWGPSLLSLWTHSVACAGPIRAIRPDALTMHCPCSSTSLSCVNWSLVTPIRSGWRGCYLLLVRPCRICPLGLPLWAASVCFQIGKAQTAQLHFSAAPVLHSLVESKQKAEEMMLLCPFVKTCSKWDQEIIWEQCLCLKAFPCLCGDSGWIKCWQRLTAALQGFRPPSTFPLRSAHWGLSATPTFRMQGYPATHLWLFLTKKGFLDFHLFWPRPRSNTLMYGGRNESPPAKYLLCFHT